MVVLIVIIIAVFFLQDILFHRLAPRKLSYVCEFEHKEAVEGDTVRFVETIQNNKPIPVLWMMIDIHASRYLDFGGAWSVLTQEGRRVTSLFTLRGMQKVTRKWDMTCTKRGVYTINNVTLVWGALFGGKNGSKALASGTSIIVYPRAVDLDSLFTPVNLTQGEVSVSRFIVDDPFVFTGVREYSTNDPMNRVHWGATARAGTLMVRQNDYTSEVSVVIALNIQATEFEVRDSVNEPKSEFAIKVAATAAQKAIDSGAMCALYTNASTIDGGDVMAATEFGSGETHMMLINDVLARLECKNYREFADYLEEFGMGRENCEIVVVTSYLSERLALRCEELRLRGNVVKVLLLDKYSDTAQDFGFGLYSVEREVMG